MALGLGIAGAYGPRPDYGERGIEAISDASGVRRAPPRPTRALAPTAPPRSQVTEETATLEVERLHRFFADWFTARSPQEFEYFRAFTDVMGDTFAMVPWGVGRGVPRHS